MKKVFAVLIVMALIFTGCGNSKNETKEKSSDESKIKASVVKIEKTKEDKWDELGEGKDLVLVYMKIENTSNETYEFIPDYVSLKTDSKTLNITDVAPKDDKEILHTRNIEPGETLEGIVCFEVNENQEFKVLYDLEPID